jgi:PqqD family protein of HPr-rel-A system
LRRAPGVRLEALPGCWVAFSATSGETHLLNDTCAAIVDLLSDDETRSEAQVVAALAAESGSPVPDVQGLLGEVWNTLLDAGLLRRVPAP